MMDTKKESRRGNEHVEQSCHLGNTGRITDKAQLLPPKHHKEALVRGKQSKTLAIKTRMVSFQNSGRKALADLLAKSQINRIYFSKTHEEQSSFLFGIHCFYRSVKQQCKTLHRHIQANSAREAVSSIRRNNTTQQLQQAMPHKTQSGTFTCFI